jgi:5-methylcytosine-specific restriction endonuclease McrA
MDKETQKHILNILRQGTLTWHVRNKVLNRGRYQVVVGKRKNGEDKKIWYRKCDGGCGSAYALKDSLLEVDHVVPVLNFKGDWTEYIEKMYCDEKNLQALCHSCHLKKTQLDIAPLRYERKNKSLDTEAPISMEEAHNML